MSSSCNKSGRRGTREIQWHLLDDSAKKISKASGIKIEYSMSDEIDCAQKLSIAMRKKFMRQLFEDENEMYRQELNSMGLMYAPDIVCEEVRKCALEEVRKKKPAYINSAQKSNLWILFKMFEE